MAENSTRSPKRGPGRPFEKGVSPNPGGRPKVLANVRDLARDYTERAVETLAAIMLRGDSDSARARAAETLLNRGWGSVAAAPPPFTDNESPVVEPTDVDYSKLTILELRTLRALRQKAKVDP